MLTGLVQDKVDGVTVQRLLDHYDTQREEIATLAQQAERLQHFFNSSSWATGIEALEATVSERVRHDDFDYTGGTMSDPHKLLQEMHKAGLITVSAAHLGACRRCGFREDLRFGVCFVCSSYIYGTRHGDNIHELWDRDNPSNRWIVSVTP